jgi:maltose-binding protein MalE
MVGVQAVAVSGSSEHAVIAMEFVRGYLSTLEVQRELHEADPRVAVLIELSNELTDQRDVGFTMAFRQGSPIPPLAEMDQAWMIVGDALARVRQGLVTGVEALERADELLQEAVGSS